MYATLLTTLVFLSPLFVLGADTPIKDSGDFRRWLEDVSDPQGETTRAVFKNHLKVDLQKKIWNIRRPGSSIVNDGNFEVEIHSGTLKFDDVQGITIKDIYIHECMPDVAHDKTDLRDCLAFTGNTQVTISRCTLSRAGDELLNCRLLEDESPTTIVVENSLFIHHYKDSKYNDADKVLSAINYCHTTLKYNMFYDTSRIVTNVDMSGATNTLIMKYNVLDEPRSDYWFELKRTKGVRDVTIQNNWFRDADDGIIDAKWGSIPLSSSNCVCDGGTTLPPNCAKPCPDENKAVWSSVVKESGASGFKLKDFGVLKDEL